MSSELPASSSRSQSVTLASGATMTVGEAASALAVLRASEGPVGEWEILPLLRDLAMGKTLEREQLNELRVNSFFFGQDNELEPSLRDFVLAAVRGKGDKLYIHSDVFTDEFQQTLVEYLAAKIDLQMRLSKDEFHQLNADPVDEKIKQFRKMLKQDTPPLPEHMKSESYWQDIQKRADRKNNDQGPTSPP